ncbi:MAG TPA: response regulator [Steroidobacteraceae bacterium]|jgi:FixJ family two-component response regulator|nr:response regulator [Steroidobacteraceae bacterium]
MAKRKRQFFVAIVDDDAGMRAAIKDLLNSNGWRTRSFPSAEAFLQSMDGGEPPGCLILDYRLPGMSGLELHRELQAKGRAIPVIFATADDQAFRLLKSSAAKADALAVLRKPFDPDELPRLVKAAAQARRKR